MNDDYLINLLPSEYLPKPEFKGFPVFILALLLFTGLFVFQDYTRIMNKLNYLETEKITQTTLIKNRTPGAMKSLGLQARSRMLFSYGISIWAVMHQTPPWVDVYNEIEVMIPDGMWIESLKLTGGGESKWPNFTLVGLVAGNEPGIVLDFYEKMLDPESKFEKVKISGYTFTRFNGQDAVTFNMRFSLNKNKFMGL
jgi:hypothetical protein